VGVAVGVPVGAPVGMPVGMPVGAYVKLVTVGDFVGLAVGIQGMSLS